MVASPPGAPSRLKLEFLEDGIAITGVSLASAAGGRLDV
jgi:hypothetical protein